MLSLFINVFVNDIEALNTNNNQMNTIVEMDISDNGSKWGLLGLLGLFGLAGLRKEEYTSKFTTSATPQNR
jgi:hypothetical protein